MSEDQFTKLFKYMEAFRKSVEQRFEKEEHEHAEIQATIGELSARVEEYHNEVVVLGHQFATHTH